MTKEATTLKKTLEINYSVETWGEAHLIGIDWAKGLLADHNDGYYEGKDDLFVQYIEYLTMMQFTQEVNSFVQLLLTKQEYSNVRCNYPNPVVFKDAEMEAHHVERWVANIDRIRLED